jgi:hypothetical protein
VYNEHINTKQPIMNEVILSSPIFVAAWLVAVAVAFVGAIWSANQPLNDNLDI